jgi:hypothetical protein
MYDIHFIVKYKSIEEELINKIKNGEESYTVDDIHTICEELYRHEILSVFKIDIFDDIQMQDTITEIWNKLQLDIDFMEVIDRYSTKLLLDTSTNINTFILMFNYEFFFLLHICICKCIQNKKIDKEILDKLNLQISNL